MFQQEVWKPMILVTNSLEASEFESENLLVKCPVPGTIVSSGKYINTYVIWHSW